MRRYAVASVAVAVTASTSGGTEEYLVRVDNQSRTTSAGPELLGEVFAEIAAAWMAGTQ